MEAATNNMPGSSQDNSEFHEDMYSRIINVLWISHHEMASDMLDALSKYIQDNFNTDCFGVKSFTDSYEKLLFDDIDLDYDMICVDGQPRFISDLFYKKKHVPLLTFSRYNNENKWYRYIALAEDQNAKKHSNIAFILGSVAFFGLFLGGLRHFSNRLEAESVILKNLEHRMQANVELLDFEHLENDVYLARCYANEEEFNAYLYYDTSTVRVDEGSYVHVPEGVEH